jgi:formyl-CoA transferase
MTMVLKGIKVLDFSQYIAGPYAAMLLSEQGAEVTKVERPGGDPFRGRPGFLVWNRSKRGITLNLKQPEGRQIAGELARQSDVIIESFRPGVADRLGIGYEAFRALNPRVVYCSISGFGPDGPYRDIPGWDALVGSMMSLYISQGGSGGPPLYLVMPMPSYYTAFMASFSIATALLTRETTGRGQKVDVSLYRTMLHVAAAGVINFEGKIALPGIVRDPQGMSPLYRLYHGSDGKWFFLGLGNLRFFAKFAVAVGHEEWLTDPRFDGAPFLILPPTSEELVAIFQKMFLTRTRDEWLEFLRAADIPCAPASTVEEFLDDPQVLANGMVATVNDPNLGKVREMGVPVRLSRTPGEVKGPSPTLGQHTDKVLGELGRSVQEIARLREQGVI